MRLFRGNVEQSIKDFDDGLEKYFSTSRKYRSRLRKGSIVLLDDNSDLFDLFTFLNDKCGLDVGIVHIGEACCAKKAVEDIGPGNVKAVVIDENMLGKSMNGDSFPSWLNKNFPRIPVWVVNCSQEKKVWIRRQTRKVGVLIKGVSLLKVVEAVGYPSECEVFMDQYAH